MTVSAQTLAFEYAANGVTTTFPYGFRVLYADQVKVYVNGTLQVGGYTLTGVGDAGGGNVEFSVAPVNGSTVLVRRISDRVRSTDFQQAPYFTQEELLDIDQDYQTMLLQEAAADGDNSLKIPAEEALETLLPAAELRANKAIVFDALGNVTVSEDDYEDQVAAVAASAAAALASENAAEAAALAASNSEAAADASEAAAAASAAAASASANAAAGTYYVATKSAGNTLAASLPNGATVIVTADESQGGVRVRYTVASGVLTAGIVDISDMAQFTPVGTNAVATTVSAALDGMAPGANLTNIHAFANAIKALDRAVIGTTYVSITGYGDSMASDSYTLGVVAKSLQYRYGIGGIFTPGFGQTSNGAAWTFTGGAAQPRSDYTYFPGANQITMPVGSTATTTLANFNLPSGVITDGAFPAQYSVGPLVDFRKVRLFYLTRPGDGTLTFTITNAGDTISPVVVNCDAALSLQYTDVTLTSPTYSLQIAAAASVGACVFVGAVALRDSGVLFWLSQVGGSTMEQQKTYIANGNVNGVYKTLFDTLNTKMVIHAQRVPSDANYQANYVQVFDALTALGPTQFVLGEPPLLVEGTPNVPTINKYLRDQCIARGFPFYDQYVAMGSNNAILTSLGWGDSDGLHLDAPAHRFLAGLILESVNWFRLGGSGIDIEPVNMTRLVQERFTFMALHKSRMNTLIGNAAQLPTGTLTSGGFTYTSTNDRGWLLQSIAATGYVATRIGICHGPANIATNTNDVSIALTAWRNLTFVSGLRAFMLFGVTATKTTLVGLNERCFGLEWALGSDVGSPGGITGPVVRLLVCDGATTTYSDWVGELNLGQGGQSIQGLSAVIRWNRATGLLSLMRGSSGAAIYEAARLRTTVLNTATAGSWVNMALVAEGAAPASTGIFSMLEVSCITGNDNVFATRPYGNAT